MMAEIHDVHLFQRKSLRVTMLRMMLGTYRELFELGSAANVQCYNCSEKVTLFDEQNDFLVADVTRMEEIEELSANICLMAIIQPANINSDERPSYDSTFLSKVQRPSISYDNSLFAKDNQEQKYLKQPKIINNTLGDDQIDSNIIFDEPNVDVNSGSVEYDNNVQASYELEQLARNTYKEAEKQQINAKSDPKILVNVRDTEDILEDATKSQKTMENKLNDPVAIEKKQNFRLINYNKLNALYEDFVSQKELSAKQKYFSSTFIPSENSSNASTSTSSSETKPSVASMPSSNPMKLYLEKMENEFKSHECESNNVQDESEKIKRDSIEIQE
ncbi:hypothetical protein Tco_0090539 [Tanacetum coccineum]